MKQFLKTIDFSEKSTIQAEQVHSNKVNVVSRLDQKKLIPQTDGLVSIDALGDIALIVRTADCVPLLLLEEKKGIIAAVHSGWRGTFANIVAETMNTLISEGGTKEFVTVLIGPHIRSCCYCVPQERAKLFEEKWGPDSYELRSHKYFLSLENIIVEQLKTSGIHTDQIKSIDHCTSCKNDLYFSYRKDSKETFGEQIGIITLSRYN